MNAYYGKKKEDVNLRRVMKRDPDSIKSIP